MFPTALFVFVVVTFNSVICEKKSCDLEDTECMTRSSNLILGQLIAGEPIIEPSDPLHRDSIEVNLPKFWLKLTNASLSGMIKCQLEFLKIIKKDLKYECHVKCPHLTLDSEYDVKGKLASAFLDGTGTCRVDFYGYNVFFGGDYEKKNKNGKEHIYFKNNKLDVWVMEKTHYDFKNLFNGDKEKSDAVHKILNENWTMVDNQTYLAIMEPFMNKYVDNVNAFSDIIPVEVFFSRQ